MTRPCHVSVTSLSRPCHVARPCHVDTPPPPHIGAAQLIRRIPSASRPRALRPSRVARARRPRTRAAPRAAAAPAARRSKTTRAQPPPRPNLSAAAHRSLPSSDPGREAGGSGCRPGRRACRRLPSGAGGAGGAMACAELGRDAKRSRRTLPAGLSLEARKAGRGAGASFPAPPSLSPPRKPVGNPDRRIRLSSVLPPKAQTSGFCCAAQMRPCRHGCSLCASPCAGRGTRVTSK